MEVQRAHQTRERSRPPSITQSKPTPNSRNAGHCSAPPDTYATSRDALGRKAARRLKVLSAEDVLGELFRKEDALHSLRILAKTGTGVIYQEEIPQDIPPQPLSPSSSQYSRTSTRTWSSQGLEERVGSSFLRMAFEEEEEQEEEHDLSADTVLTDREYDSRPLDVRPAGIVLPAAPIPSSCPAPSSEVSVLYLDELEEHASDSKKGHPYSVSCLEAKRSVTATRSSASSAKQSVSSRSSSSASALSYALKEDEAYSRPFAMEHISKSTEGYVDVGSASTPANVAVQDVSIDEVSRRNGYRRQTPAGILITPAEDDKNGTHLQQPTSSNSDALPQLPRLIPQSPLSASFDRDFGLSPSSVSSATGLSVPAETRVSKQRPSGSPGKTPSRRQRSSLGTIQTDSGESVLSRRPLSISTLAFGNLKSETVENESHWDEIGSDTEDYSNHLHGYEGDYDSASAESSSEGEVDFVKYYQRRVSEDLQHVHQTYSAIPSRRTSQQLRKNSKDKGVPKDGFTKQYRRRTIQMDGGRGTSFYSSGDDKEHERYLTEVQIIDLRVVTQQDLAPERPGHLRRLRSNSHANITVDPGSTADHPSNNRRYTTLTTDTTASSPDGITTLSAFHFVDEDPWSSTEYERDAKTEDPRISISSTIYSESFYDPYDVLPTPRTVPTLSSPQPGRPSRVIDTMRRGARSTYSELEDRASFMELVSPTHDSKPPLPTTPKPDFSTLYSAGRSSRSLERRLPNQEQGRRAHKISSPYSHSNSRANSYEDEFDMQPPPTQNTLDPLSRAGLVRKSRKLAQVFGQTPNGASIRPTASGIAESSGLRSSFLEITSPTTSRHHSSNSMAVFSKDHSSDTKERVKENVDRVKGKGIWPPPASTRYISAVSGRRHSTPLTPDEFEFLNELHRQEPVSDADRTSSFFSSGENENLIEIGEAQEVERDRASFIDWDEESPGMHENGPEDTRRHTHPVELLTQSPSGSQNSSRTSISSLAFAPPSAYPGGAPRNSFTREDYIGTELPVAPFDNPADDDEPQRNSHQQHLDRQPSLASLITPSLMSPEERAEAEKRRKREKLAKLHRFLGSRVPAGLVLGQSDEDSESGLPGLSMAEETDAEGSSEEKRSWKRGMTKVARRRSGSESGVSSDWSDIRDRRKDDMGEGEKLRMVKRAIRLEKVFGVAPPQTLYAYGHVPHAHSSPGVIASTTIAPTMIRSSSTSVAHAHPQLASSSSTSKRALTRPISRELLLPKDNDTDQIETAIDVEIEAGDASMALPMTRPRGASITFTHYEHSLNSLGDILDRDDRASLQELHDILYQAGGMEEGFLPESDQVLDVSLGSGSVRSERRRSLPALPARTSIASFNSIDSVASIITKVSLDDADVEGSDGVFQVRRRRAAKLTQFFGVNYRDLVEDVLDSIEKGVELENGKGLSTQEAEDLLMKLRTLKGKRTGLLS